MTAPDARETDVVVPGQRRARPILDVSALPDVVFGSRDIMWWGTLGFIVIEGFTLVLCAAAYLYLRQNFATWPPENTPTPSLLVPTINLVLMLASIPFIHWLSNRARELDLQRVRFGLLIATLLNGTFFGLRVWELTKSLHVKWDANAYGSAQWLVVGMHGTLLLVEFIEILGVTIMFWLLPVEEKHFSDAADVGFYWYFMVAAWVPLYLLCFLLPYWV